MVRRIVASLAAVAAAGLLSASPAWAQQAGRGGNPGGNPGGGNPGGGNTGGGNTGGGNTGSGGGGSHGSGGRHVIPEFDPATAGAIAVMVAGGTVLIARRRKR